MNHSLYPKIHIRSKNELAKHISYKSFPQREALNLINDCLENFDLYWRDNECAASDPGNGKYVRHAFHPNLEKLLDLVNARVLAPHDNEVPGFVFGGLQSRSHVSAAHNLLGKKRRRSLVRIDLKGFFEQIEVDRVKKFFILSGCSVRVAKILSRVCCIPRGPKGSTSTPVVARGFAPSSRLVVWCSLNIFMKVEKRVRQDLCGHDPRIAIFVDDIGITASRVSLEKLQVMASRVKDILRNYDEAQPLKVNEDKSGKVFTHVEGMEFVGLELRRNALGLGKRAKGRLASKKRKRQKDIAQTGKSNLTKSVKSMERYKRFVESR